MLIEKDGKLLLVRRGVEPGKGRWDVPGGFLEEGERPEDGARREIREELAIELGPLHLAQTEVNPQPEGAVLDILFEAAAFTGAPRAGSDAAELGWFAPDALPGDLAFDATRRILARWALRIPRDHRLLGGECVAPEASPPAAAYGPPWSALPRGAHVECGEWSIHDGALCGRIDGERPAVLWLEPELPGDHMLSFAAATVPPHANDVNCFWEGAGTIAERDPDAWCTIGGFGGWWGGLTGIERYPEGGERATARLVALEPGRTYELAAGRRGATDFLFVDGALAMQLDDMAARRRPTSRVALATWNGHVHFTRVALHALAAAGRP